VLLMTSHCQPRMTTIFDSAEESVEIREQGESVVPNMAQLGRGLVTLGFSSLA
jgi:hypothetical protein